MPETFDVFGASHQILHVMVIFAGLAHMRGLFRAFDHAHSSVASKSVDEIGDIRAMIHIDYQWPT